MTRLRVVAGPSTSELVLITANSGIPHRIRSDAFDGEVLAYIKGFTDEDGNVLESEYFERDDRKGITWSIQVQGRFLRPISADDVMFGNTFDRPLKLPWGSSAALKFMHLVDPTLEHDLASHTKPWALSPLISTMPHLSHAHSAPPFPPPTSVTDDTSELHLTLRSGSTSPQSLSPSPSVSPHGSPTLLLPEECPKRRNRQSMGPPSPTQDGDAAQMKRSNRLSTGSLASIASLLSASAVDKRERRRAEKAARKVERLRELGTNGERRAYFRHAEHRREIVFGPDDVLTMDFCYGFINFSPTLALHLPGGISFDLMHYWDGQPVRFVCCERNKTPPAGEGEAEDYTPWGRVLWCVAIELVEQQEESDVN